MKPQGITHPSNCQGPCAADEVMGPQFPNRDGKGLGIGNPSPSLRRSSPSLVLMFGDGKGGHDHCKRDESGPPNHVSSSSCAKPHRPERSGRQEELLKEPGQTSHRTWPIWKSHHRIFEAYGRRIGQAGKIHITLTAKRRPRRPGGPTTPDHLEDPTPCFGAQTVAYMKIPRSYMVSINIYNTSI